VLERFEDAWRAGRRPALGEYLAEAQGQAEQHALLVELAHADLEYRLRAGDAARVEEYLRRYGELANDPQAALGLIAAEYRLRRRQEAGLTDEEYLGRFPDHRAGLRPLLAEASGTLLAEDPPAPPQRDLAAPTVPGYEVLGELGRGGMGVVLRCRDLDFGRDLAVKLLPDGYRDCPDLVRRFLEEARVMGRLQHPGVPPVHALGRLPDGRPFFAMKLVKGRTLAELLRQRRAPDEDLPRFLTVFTQVCQTLAYAHACGLIHRDLKPSNVMVGAFGEVQVMDWGLAKQTGAGSPNPAAREPLTGGAGPDPGATIHVVPGADAGSDVVSTSCPERPTLATRPGSVLGTPAYMPPEQARGEVDNLDERSDVFGLGAVLCELLTGRPPYLGATADEVHRQAACADLADAFARLEACAADAALVRLAKACLHADREGRPADAGAVERAVTAHLEGVRERLRQAELERAASQARAREERKRRRLKAGLAAALLALAALGAAAGLWLNAQQAERQAELARQARAVEAALEQTAALQRQGRWAEAKAVLDQAESRQGEGRLGPAAGAAAAGPQRPGAGR
jgi:serine/threonine-protein kinase